MITASQLVVGARSLIGTPYRHQGRGSTGVDCIGFLFASCNAAGFELTKLLSEMQWDYSQMPDGKALTRAAKWLVPTVPEEGALVLFQYPKAPHPQHFAILADSGRTMIHAHQPMKKVVEHGFRPPWTRWVHSVYRIPGIEYGSTV
jgi:cell wall-associated NlpC family hydrolase